jgi:hypothetical protein
MAGTVIDSLIQGLTELRQKRYDFLVEQAFLLTRGKLIERFQKDMEAIRERFATSKIGDIEAEVTKLSTIKASLSERLRYTRKGLSDMVDVHAQLVVLREAALAGDAGAFDAAQGAIEAKITSGTDDPQNLVGNLDYGVTGVRSVFVDLGPAGSISIRTQAIGSRYRLNIAGATGGEPDFIGQTLNINGSDRPFSGLTLVSRAGNDLSFKDGASTYSATLMPGGLGVASAWVYEGLSTAQGRTQALADVDAALAKLIELERGFAAAEQTLQSAAAGVQRRLADLGAEVRNVAETEASERNAAAKAAQAKLDLQVTQIALLGNVQRAQAMLLFEPPKIYEQDLFDILIDRRR